VRSSADDSGLKSCTRILAPPVEAPPPHGFSQKDPAGIEEQCDARMAWKSPGQAAQTAARDRPFHPLRAYLKGLRWDGVKRVDRWLTTYLGAAETEYSRAVGSRWLISAVARIFRPGSKADCCLILEGPQGIRKSTALRTLAGEYFTDELADLGSKDAAMQTRGAWIIELSELDSLSHSDVARIKAFMSRTTDRFRPPYGMRLVESPRQCVFAGTVNHSTYLRDETGGRRFWPVTCGCIAVETLARDRDQLWAEAKARFEAGSVWWLDTAELIQLASDQQVDRYEGDPGKKSSLRGSKRGRACPSARCSKNALPSRRPSGRKRTRSGRRGACEPKAGSGFESGWGAAWIGVTERRRSDVPSHTMRCPISELSQEEAQPRVPSPIVSIYGCISSLRRLPPKQPLNGVETEVKSSTLSGSSGSP
jgi:hypothetical protein